MRRIGVDPAYLGTDGDVLPPDPHPVRAIEDRASQRPRRLEADEQYRRLPSPQIMPQMMANAPGLTHPRSRHDDCAGQAVEPHRFRSVQDIVEGRMMENLARAHVLRSEEHTSELQSLMRISYAVFCLKKKYIQHVCI